MVNIFTLPFRNNYFRLNAPNIIFLKSFMSVLFTRLYLCAMREIPFLISFSTNTYISTSEKKFFYASLDIIRYFYRFSNLISLSYFQYQFFYQVFHLNCQLLRFSWLVRILIHDKYWSLQRKKLVRLQMHFLREELYLLNCEYRSFREMHFLREQ